MNKDQSDVIKKQQEIINDLLKIIPYIKNGLNEIGDKETVDKINNIQTKIKEL